MRRGTTPTITLTVSGIDDLTALKNVSVALKQGQNLIVKDKTSADISITKSSVVLHLSQEDTLALKASQSVKVQVKCLTSEDEVFATNIAKVAVSDILDEEVMT